MTAAIATRRLPIARAKETATPAAIAARPKLRAAADQATRSSRRHRDPKRERTPATTRAHQTHPPAIARLST
jgi:hypothetical protein